MNIHYHYKFLKEYQKLPNNIKELAKLREKIFKEDPFDKRLKTHKLHGNMSSFWTFSINLKHRIIFKFASKDIVDFYYVGDHDIYE